MAANRLELSTLLPAAIPSAAPPTTAGLPPIDDSLRTEARDALAAIDAVGAGGCIASDCDGTIWAGDVGDELVRLAEAHPHLFPGAAVDTPSYFERMELDYIGGCLESAALTRTAAQRDVQAALLEWLQGRVAPRLWLVEALVAAAERGVRVVAVSASARLAVEAGLRRCGLAGHCEVIGVEPTPTGFVSPVPIGAGKVAALQRIGVRRVDVALGDSRWDGPLLCAAERGLLLRPGSQANDVQLSAAALRG